VVNRNANLPVAQAFVDFLVSAEGQKLFAEQNYEYPLLPGVALRTGVQPLTGLQLANVNMAEATRAFDATFALLETAGLP
jgi:iron(III) transport system substrate-binding protein